MVDRVNPRNMPVVERRMESTFKSRHTEAITTSNATGKAICKYLLFRFIMEVHLVFFWKEAS